MSEVAPNDLPEDEQTAPRQIKHSLGEQLSAEREAKGWTVEYVAGQLNLATRQIQALESDNYAALPGMASVRGFVRAYAKLLRIDANPLVALIAAEQITPNLPLEPRPNVKAAPFSESRLSGGSQRNSPIKGILIAIVFVLLALAIIGVEHFGGWPTLSESLSSQFKELSSASATSGSTPAGENHELADDSNVAAKPIQDTAESPPKDASAPISAPLASAEAPVKSPGSAAQSGTGAGATVPAQPAKPVSADVPHNFPASAPPGVTSGAPSTTTTPVVVAAPVLAPAKAKPEPVAPAKPELPRQASPGKKKLQLTARENSWVEVREGNNVVLSRLLKAGESESLDVAGGAFLVIGNAAGVDVSFAGQPLPSKTDPKSNVGRLSLK
ncbi:MAG TPA: RodZ domain-containing protein [Burkholderiaceae bacterium]|jgi:cytoskeleton protein RodZ